MSFSRNSKLVTKKLIHYLIPSILMVFAMQFSSLLDGILVGNFLGGDALAATSLVVPILYIIQLPGFALGVGGSIVVANLLGKRDISGAKKVFSFCMIAGLAASAVFAILGIFVASPIAKIFGESCYEYTFPFVQVYLFVDPIITMLLLITSFMAVDNNPKLSSITFIIGNAAKIGLEVLFIQVFQWGIMGAALSTGAGYLLSWVMIIFYAKSKKRLLSFTFKIKGADIKAIFKASSTSAINMILTAVQMLVVNIFIGLWITDSMDLLIYGLIANMVFAFDLFCGGIINVIPSICGVFYGEKEYYSLKSVAKKIYWINIGVTVLIMALIVSFPGAYATLFGFSDIASDAVMAWNMRIYALSFLGYSINKFSMNYYPTVEKNTPSIITVFLREAILVIPLSLVFLKIQGINGYSIAAVITESATALMTYGYILIFNKRHKTKGLLMIETEQFKKYEASVVNGPTEASEISNEIIEFASINGVPHRESQIVGLATEEMVDNIISYGYKKGTKNYIDVSCKINDESVVLSFMDDGMPFDPTKYDFDEEEGYSTSGIALISKLTDKMSYMRVLNLNNTVIEIDLKGEKEDGNQH